VVIYLSEGKAVSIVPVNTELTTQEAADILNVSRPYLIKILEKGLIPFSKVGTHRRIRFSDLMKFKENRDTQQQEGLAEITRITQELGTYD
jgi:excisionase family DNA binding protein